MACAYCGKPATRLDLCHSRTPVCDKHLGLGHQTAPAPKASKK